MGTVGLAYAQGEQTMRSRHVRCHVIATVSAMFLTLSLIPAAQADVIFVDKLAVGSGNGSTWDNAFTDLQPALATAGFGDELWVAANTYYPGSSRLDTFNLIDGVSIYGGFLGTLYPGGGETVLSQRDPKNNITVLSGDIGVVGLDTDNSYHVVFSDVTDKAVLNGFTISGGYADGVNASTGGGMVLVGLARAVTEPFIVRCIVRDNFATTQGGGVCVTGGGPDPTFVNCSFISNEAGGASGEGGAIHLQDGQGAATLINCLFADNTSISHGGAVDSSDSDPLFINCTFSGNSAGTGGPAPGGGGIYGETSAVITVINSILWDNSPEQIKLVASSTATVSYSDVEGGWTGATNIDVDPLFVDPVGLDFRLAVNSPCIDVGNDGDVPLDAADVNDDGDTSETLPWDLAELSRIFPFGVDMGSYEYQPPPCPWDCDGSNDDVVGINDFLAVLAQWGGPGSCDFNGGGVGINDFLLLLANWGPCPESGMPPPMTLQQELDDACLTQSDWDEYEDVITDPNSKASEKLRYDCWMRHYLFDCPACSCSRTHCPGKDPFS